MLAVHGCSAIFLFPRTPERSARSQANVPAACRQSIRPARASLAGTRLRVTHRTTPAAASTRFACGVRAVTVVAEAASTPHNFGPASVDAWLEFMAAKGIQRVVCLMNEAELKRFDVDLLAAYKARFVDVQTVAMGSEGAAAQLAAAYSAAYDAGEKVVTHCVGGQMRTGLALSAGLAQKYDLSPEEAVGEMLASAAEYEVSRATKAEKLAKFLEQ